MNSSQSLIAHGLLVLLLCFFAIRLEGTVSNVLEGIAGFFLVIQIFIAIGLVAKKLRNNGRV